MDTMHSYEEQNKSNKIKLIEKNSGNKFEFFKEEQDDEEIESFDGEEDLELTWLPNNFMLSKREVGMIEGYVNCEAELNELIQLHSQHTNSTFINQWFVASNLTLKHKCDPFTSLQSFQLYIFKWSFLH